MENLAKRFLEAFNIIDFTLRSRYAHRNTYSFNDVVRQSVKQNSVVRKYEDRLIQYSRLRNAIVHTLNPKIVIAEPHEDVVLEMEKIAKLLSTPPKIINYAKREVVGVESKVKIKEVLMLAYEKGYSNIAVFEKGAIVGVANISMVTRTLGKALVSGKDIAQYIEKTAIKDVIDKLKEVVYYSIQAESLTVEEVLNLFTENRKLTCIVLTKNGNFLEQPTGIVTTGDIIDLNRVLEDY